jgi:small subunit ribosomal protein S13
MAEQNKQPAEKKGAPEGKKPAEAPKTARPVLQGQQIIRFAETNIDGAKVVEESIRRIDGISFMLSRAIAKKLSLSGKKFGDLSEKDLKLLEDAIANPMSIGIPRWMINHSNEPVTGKDKHLTASQLDFTTKMDINELKKMKCYKGVRHIQGQPVRGQRTRSSFRKGKSVGVRRKKPEPAAAAKK